jgi:hypothetical protein
MDGGFCGQGRQTGETEDDKEDEGQVGLIQEKKRKGQGGGVPPDLQDGGD